MLSTLFRTAALGALLLLAACDRQSASTATPTADLPKTLRVYTVPAERAEAKKRRSSIFAKKLNTTPATCPKPSTFRWRIWRPS